MRTLKVLELGRLSQSGGGAAASFRWLVATAISLLALAAFGFGLRFFANPQIVQGQSNSFPAIANNAPANGQTWDVVNSGGTIVATSSTPNGWTVSFSSPTFTVGAPSGAVVATNYQVRYASGQVVLVKTAKKKLRPVPVVGSAASPQVQILGRAASPMPARPQPQSALFDVIAASGAPSAPTNLVATAVSQTQINLTWTNTSTTQTAVLIERAPGTTTNFSQIASVSGTSTTYSDSTLTTLTTYSYRVRSSNASGYSTYSNTATATTFDNPPAAPSNLGGTAVSSSQINIAWQSNSTNQTGFLIQMKVGIGGTYAQIASVAANVTSYSCFGLNPNTLYVFRVCAFNPSGGNSAWSNEAALKTLNGPPPPPSTLGTEFWAAFPGSPGTNDQQGNAKQLQLLITADQAATGTVSAPGVGFSQAFSVAAGGATTVVLPESCELTTNDGTASNGVHILSSVPIAVRTLNNLSAETDGAVVLPLNLLGTQYYDLCYQGGNFQGQLFFNSQVSLVATQDNTTVTVVPSVACGTARAQGVPYTVTLNTGQTYQVQALTPKDLSGTYISSNNPIGVYGGNDLGFVPYTAPYGNQMVEEMPPVNRWGMTFYTVPLATRTLGDRFRILAAYVGTNVSINGAAPVTLDSGQYLEKTLTSASTITANKPILVAQYSQSDTVDGNTNSDPSMSIVPSVEQYFYSCRVLVPTSVGSMTTFTQNYLNVVAPTAAIGDISLDGTVIASSSFTAIGSSGYAAAQLSVGQSGTVHLVSTPNTGLSFGVVQYGFGSYDAYSFPPEFTLPLSTYGVSSNPPAAPSNLNAVAASSSQINLTWQDNSNGSATGFRVERMGSSGTWAQIASVAGSVTTYSDTGLTPATQYSYRVRAFNDLFSAYSNTATATTFQVPPAAPTNLTLTVISQTQINLTWQSNSTNQTGFKVERCPGTSGNWAQITLTQANQTTYPDPSLAANTTYSYRVRATNSAGDSAYTNVATATTLDYPPTAPSGLTATGVSTSQINLSWTSTSTNQTGFIIQRTPANQNAWAQVTTVSASTTTYQDTGLMDATSYSYRVCATNSGGNSPWSNTATASTLIPPPPTAPTGLTATAISSSQIQLAWTNTATNQDGFNIQRIGGGSNTWTTVATVGAGVRSYTDGSLTASTLYSYQVAAYNGGGSSAWSNTASATTLAAPPAADLQLIAVATGANKIALYWPAVSGATGYNVYRTLTSGTGYVKLNGAPVAPPDPTPGVTNEYLYLDTSVSTGITYYYVVAPVYPPNTEGTWSEEEQTTPDPNAIPWDTANAASITGDIANIVGDPSAAVSVNGPDGAVFMTHLDGSAPSVTAPQGYYDPASNLLHDPSGSGFPVTLDGLFGGPGSPNFVADRDNSPWQNFLAAVGGGVLQASGETSYSPTTPYPTGIFRKVQATKGFRSFEGLPTLPPIADSSSNINYKSPTQDTAYIYTGGESHKVALDIGFIKGAPDNQVSGWGLFALGAYFPDGSRAPRYSATMFNEPNKPSSPMGNIRFAGPASISLFLPGYNSLLKDQMGFIVVDAADAGGVVITPGLPVPQHIVLGLFMPGFNKNEYQNFNLKRVNSIAQTLLSATGKGPAGATVRANAGPGSTPGYYFASSKVIGATWGYDGTSGAQVDYQDLEQNVNILKAGAYPMDKHITESVVNPWFIERDIYMSTSNPP